MTVYVKKVGTGERNSNVVGKLYLGDDASGDSEFLFDLVAGCFPTWTWDPRAGCNLLVGRSAAAKRTAALTQNNTSSARANIAVCKN